MKAVDYWRLCNKLTVRQAALLTMGEDPADYAYHDLVEKPYDALVQAINDGILAKQIEGQVIHPNEFGPDHTESWVNRGSFGTWLTEKGITTGFFSPEAKDTPNYLNPNHRNYSPKLAAAVTAWTAVTTDKKYRDNGQSVKSNIVNWLTAHASEFGLIKDDGTINSSAINDQIALVANFDTKGGAPATPVVEPTPQNTKATPPSFDDDDEPPF